jgi:hypothetical protein
MLRGHDGELQQQIIHSNSPGSLAIFTAILRASSRVSSVAAERNWPKTPSHLIELPLRRHSSNGGSTHS